MKIRSYEKAVEYLESFIGKVRFEITPEFLKHHDPLERMRVLLSLLGNPQNKFPSVLVGGTSGKGSAVYLISHILTTAGYKTGLTLSPHLQKINERIQINNKEISDNEFTKLTTSMIRIIEKMKKMKIGVPSYFEILVAMAFTYFAREKIDIAVVEVGMGGEFDATNTLNPLIAVLTNVGLDHTKVLGNTVEKIAKTKAGIIKTEDLRFRLGEFTNLQSLIVSRRHPIIVSGVTQQSVIEIVESKCKDVNAKLNLLWRDFGYKVKKENIKGINFDFISHEETLENLKLSLLGNYQVENASIAVKTVLQLRKFACLPAGRGFKVSDNVIRKALKTSFFAGRFEVVRLTSFAHHKISLTLILDGAHNPTKMKAFLETLKELFPKEKKIFIVGFKFDKDIKKMLKEILPVADKIIVTEFKGKTDMKVHASASAFKIAKEINLACRQAGKLSNKVIKVEKNSKKALKKALGNLTMEQFNNGTIIVITGSLYLVGEVRNYLFKK